MRELHLQIDEHGRITDYRVLADTEAGQRIAMAALGRILRSERPGLVDRVRSTLKRGIMSLFLCGLLPAWVVCGLFRLCRLREA